VTSFPVTWLPPPLSYSLVGSQTHCICAFRPSTPTSRWLLVKWHQFQVTSDHQRSRDVISCHVTASSSKLQHCKKSNTKDTQLFSLLQPLPGDFSQMMSLPGHFLSLEFTSRHFLSRDRLLMRATALYEVKRTIYMSFWPSTATSSWLPVKWVTWSLPVTKGHVTSFPVTWLPPPMSYRLVETETHSIRYFWAYYSHFQETSS